KAVTRIPVRARMFLEINQIVDEILRIPPVGVEHRRIAILRRPYDPIGAAISRNAGRGTGITKAVRGGPYGRRHDPGIRELEGLNGIVDAAVVQAAVDV